MGYTHYWNIDKVTAKALKEKWPEITATCKLFVENSCKRTVQREEDNKRPALFGKREIRFNGIGKDAHETFLLRPVKTRFEFCKTARKPYDLAVLGCLLIAKAFVPSFYVSSDGFGYSEYLSSDYVEEEVENVMEALKPYGFHVEFITLYGEWVGDEFIELSDKSEKNRLLEVVVHDKRNEKILCEEKERAESVLFG